MNKVFELHGLGSKILGLGFLMKNLPSDCIPGDEKHAYWGIGLMLEELGQQALEIYAELDEDDAKCQEK